MENSLKRIQLVKIILIAVLLILLIIGAFTGDSGIFRTLKEKGILSMLPLVLIIGFGIFALVSRFKSFKRKQVQEDELSKRMIEKAGYTSFQYSLFLWLVMAYCHDQNYFGDSIFGLGVIFMAILFLLSWLYYKFIARLDE
jgi:peptidoglycan/LPS O-acetylase OafA/YrhL